MKQPRRPAPAPPPALPRDEDLDFAAIMQREGVTPVAAKPSRPIRDEDLDFAALMQRAGVTPVAAKSPGPATTTPRHAPPSAVDRPAPPPTTTAAIAAPSRAAIATEAKLRADLAAARTTETALRTDLATLRTDLTTARTTEATLRSELAAARTTETALRADLATARTTTASLRAETRKPTPPPPRLAAVLAARGLLDPDEQAHALALLAAAPSPSALLDLLTTPDPAALATLLTHRLALVCDDPACAPEHGAVALRVEPPRCEVCGGSDIQRAAHGFTRACAAAGIVRVRFVGGSPNYRTKLAALFPADGPLRVRTTHGNRHVPLSQSKSQQRSDDLVIVWGATELDHATSGAYRSQFGRVEIVAHRGISRMLDLAAARITRP